MSQYTVKFCIQDKIISILFFALFAVIGHGFIKQSSKNIVVINCQPIPPQVICKIFNESDALEIPKTQLSGVKTIEGRNHKNQKTERDVLILTDNREIPLLRVYGVNQNERITAFINDPLARTLTIDPRQNFVIIVLVCSGFVAFLLCFIFKDAWINPRRNRRSS